MFKLSIFLQFSAADTKIEQTIIVKYFRSFLKSIFLILVSPFQLAAKGFRKMPLTGVEPEAFVVSRNDHSANFAIQHSLSKFFTIQ